MGKLLDDLFEKKSEQAPVPQTLTGKVIGKMVPLATGMSGLKLLTQKKPEPSPVKVEQEAISSILDPQHEAELAKIRIQAMLSDFMASDPVISTYDPDEVLDVYNQVAQMTPRAVQQPAVMRGLLRKMLQQQDAMEPFEAEQMLKVETGLKEVAEPAKPPIAPVPGTEAEGGKGED